MSDEKTAIVTGASQGVGAGLVEGFLKQGYNVVATSLNVSQSLTASPSLVLVDGDISKEETAAHRSPEMRARLGHHKARPQSNMAARPQGPLLSIRQNVCPNSRRTGLGGIAISATCVAIALV